MSFVISCGCITAPAAGQTCSASPLRGRPANSPGPYPSSRSSSWQRGRSATYRLALNTWLVSIATPIHACGTFRYILHRSSRNLHFSAVRWPSLKPTNSSVCNTGRDAWSTGELWPQKRQWGGTDRAAEGLLCHRATQAAGLQGAGVVGDVHQQVESGAGCQRPLAVRTQRVAAALQLLLHQEAAPGTRRQSGSAHSRRHRGAFRGRLGQRVGVPARPDHFGHGRVQVQLGDEAVGEAEERLDVFSGLLFQLLHCEHGRDGRHCNKMPQLLQQNTAGWTREDSLLLLLLADVACVSH